MHRGQEQLHLLPVSADELDSLAASPCNLFMDFGGSKTTACAASRVNCAEYDVRDCSSTQCDGVAGAVCGQDLLQFVVRDQRSCGAV